ncbi:hypothetical protein F4778DRAFT_786095 [Xylariomycetidae sp. FL2044]|nr:hypothetical protein F4778DRAFT_786095 [Xylariomycetidae sp. FL2044]
MSIRSNAPGDGDYSPTGDHEQLPESQSHEDEQQAFEQEQDSEHNIPLVCAICPNNSRFSDISHLLTHISSKGHLWNYFDMSISRGFDEEISNALDEFDAWFSGNGINTLLLERKLARAQRGGGSQRGRNAPRGRARRSARGRGNSRGRVNPRVTPHAHQDLHQQELKYESGDDGDYDVSYDNDHQGFGMAVNDPMHSEPGNENLSGWSVHPHSWSANMDGNMPQNVMMLGNRRARRLVSDSEVDESSSRFEGEEEYMPIPPDANTEATEDGLANIVLKGVVYEGMGGFDAATTDQRRKRNQRKEPRILEQLLVNSQAVTPDEYVLDADFNYQRTRGVYDEPSVDGSEDEEEDVKPHKTRKRHATAALVGPRNRGSVRTQQPGNYTGRTTRAKTRAAQFPPSDNRTSNNFMVDPTSGSTHAQSEWHTHGHGYYGDANGFANAFGLGPGEGWLPPSGLAAGPGLTWQQQVPEPTDHLNDGEEESVTSENERLPGLALRPGNPNLSFVTPTSGLKPSPSLYPGKENEQVSLKSPASANPYLHTHNEPAENGSYNPLYVQPRDGQGFRMYSSYDGDPKPSTSGFQPINGNVAFNSLNMPTDTTAGYRGGSPNNEFGI